jgi:hypothetical protein
MNEYAIYVARDSWRNHTVSVFSVNGDETERLLLKDTVRCVLHRTALKHGKKIADTHQQLPRRMFFLFTRPNADV